MNNISASYMCNELNSIQSLITWVIIIYEYEYNDHRTIEIKVLTWLNAIELN